jgi:hypothetical protein
LLDEREQRLFRRLSVFEGGSTLEAVEGLCAALDTESAGSQTLEGVASLLDKSLLQQREHLSGEPRLVLLETIREYGREQLAAAGEVEAVQRAHAAYYLHLAEESSVVRRGPLENAWLERCEREHENLRAALTWLLEREEEEMALRFARALREFWIQHVHFPEGRIFLERALSLSGAEVTPGRVAALGSLVWLVVNQGEPRRAEELAREYVALARQLGDTRSLAHGLEAPGLIALMQGNYPAAQAFYEENKELSQEMGGGRPLPSD